ncbi:putative sugar phosphate isomerase involved in capsule formation [Fervidobacterium pennivorans DSM 9078]|uniref:Sugar phosphate isomerase involved in capsule formation n=1 Tax=Fervidobacterium pennivorans (strain DSM 9078 / Ven5) TaxID=771875 RepID=H9UEH0_FERPD|nr:SIS domain-containing protein [Fervidobacterium pennivorans]AFG35913.1 putative sugar phosphate isomerase involved in capsule formation [Fervidobacterium pennivorans DSM 9078]
MLNHLEKQLEALKGIVERIDKVELEKLITEMVETIRNGKKIVTSALGKNVPICEKFTGTLISLGVPAYFLHTNNAVHGDLGIVKAGDLVLLLSKSGNTEESVYLYDHLKAKGANIWIMTYNENSILAKMSEKKVILYLEHEGDKWNLVPNNSSIGYLFILQAIAMELLDRLDIQIDEFKFNHPGGFIGKILRGEGV